MAVDHDPGWFARLDRAAAVAWRVLLVGAAVVAVGWALQHVWLLVVPVVAALLAASVLAPLARRLEGRGLPPLLATWLVVLAAVAVLAGLAALVAWRATTELDGVETSAQEVADDARAWLRDGPLGLSAEEVDDLERQARDALTANQEQVTGGVVQGALGLVEVVTGLLLAAVLTFFFVKDGPRLAAWVADHAPGPDRAATRAAGRAAWRTLRGYVGASALNGLVEGVLSGIALALLGVPLAAPLGLLTFFAAFVPIIGAVTVGVLATGVALVTEGPVVAALVVAVYVGIQQIEGDVLQPVIMGRVLDLHPVAVLLAVTAGGLLLGLPGAVLAVPAVAVTTSAGVAAREAGA